MEPDIGRAEKESRSIRASFLPQCDAGVLETAELDDTIGRSLCLNSQMLLTKQLGRLEGDEIRRTWWAQFGPCRIRRGNQVLPLDGGPMTDPIISDHDPERKVVLPLLQRGRTYHVPLPRTYSPFGGI